MKAAHAVLALLLPALLAGTASCSRPGWRQEGGRGQETALTVFVSIPPMAYLAAAVGGQRVRVETLVQPGQDPHTFEPAPRQMALLAEAQAFFRVGVDFENALLPRLGESVPALRVVDTRQGITLRPVEAHEEQPGHDQARGGLDPHVWMNPLLALRQAQTMREALVELDPAGRADYEKGYARLAAELQTLHEGITAALAPYRGRELFVYHPAFGYFAEAYGLRQVAVETGGKEPSAQQLARLIDQARAHDVRVIFVQPQFSQTGARAVAEAIDGAVVPLDDLAADYTANLHEVARRVAEGLAERRGGGGS